MAEALSFGMTQGVAPDQFVEVISKCAGSSWMLENRAPHIVAGDYTPQSSVNIWPKDLGIVLNIAKSCADRPLPDAIHAAHAAGFDAGELHWPYDTPAAEVKAALDATGLPLLGLNTRRGDVAGGENGMAALPGREAEARAAIDEAIAYADNVCAGAVHVM